MRLPAPAVVLICAALGQPVAAQSVTCVKAQNQMELTACTLDEWQRADAQLNEAYKRVMAALTDFDAELSPTQRGGADALKRAQRAWITFRDATCEAEGFSMRGGTAEPMVVYLCLARLTEVRTQDLEGMGWY